MLQQPQLRCTHMTQQEMLLEGYTQHKPQGLPTGLTGSSPCRSRILYPQLALLAAPWIPICSGLLLFQGSAVQCRMLLMALHLRVLHLLKCVLHLKSLTVYVDFTFRMCALEWQNMQQDCCAQTAGAQMLLLFCGPLYHFGKLMHVWLEQCDHKQIKQQCQQQEQ